MQVVDRERSEKGQQRRRTSSGKALHACCICPALAPWGGDWHAYYSVQDIEDGVPIPKFCSPECRKKGGPRAEKVTQQQLIDARAREMRPPKLVYREATEKEKYTAALNGALTP